MIQGVSSPSRDFARRLIGLLIVILMGPAPGRLAEGQAHATGKSPTPYLHAAEIFKLARSFGSASELVDSYPPIVRLAFDKSEVGAKDLRAFEENQYFVYAVGSISGPSGGFSDAHEPTPLPRLVRRFIVLKPSVFVVDDEVLFPGSRGPRAWRLYAQQMPEVSGRRARVKEGGDALFCETLLPQKVTYHLSHPSPGEPESERYLLEIVPQDNAARTRFLHVLHVREGGQEGSAVRSELMAKEGQWQLTISTPQRIFRLRLPPPNESAGDIAISTADRKTLLADRPLPSGILPHGPEGLRLLEQWDADYRDDRHPLWDTGQPSGELKRVVEERTIRPSRAVELGCGSGNDAIFLARRGFEVTAIDIAPSALSQAQQKARKAGVSVRWLLADVLAPPNLKPFDFIYDRGCYHGLRGQHLAAYLETLRRFSRPGTRFLLLAGNPNGPALDYGPPGVTEEEIREDFLSLFDLEWLRESRFEINQPGAIAPLAWSVLLRRKANP